MNTSPLNASPLNASPRLDLIGLVVSDMAASLAFYRRLGLEIPDGADSAPHVEATLPGGLRIAWDTEDVVRSFDPEWRRPEGGNRIELAFRCGSPGAVDAVYEELVAAGYRGHLKPWDAFWGQRYAVVLDPDGSGVSLFADSAADAT
ncbi:VOC family protein [Streptomyces sp. NBC_00572]|uniref:VOC family protein n=1 Tax=Streptomyces sp. NBC_00572 TaxID=2903664 RepID=UPI00225734F9|nr:VOC family protein [Streptomyces sp. NBC_00572]MCX4984232.1 VOC family protein [Streptomyces sp. NBC_00572]